MEKDLDAQTIPELTAEPQGDINETSESFLQIEIDQDNEHPQVGEFPLPQYHVYLNQDTDSREYNLGLRDDPQTARFYNSLKQKVDRIRLCICVAMYDENHEELFNTLYAIAKNISYMNRLYDERDQNAITQRDAKPSETIAVVVIQDGVNKYVEKLRKQKDKTRNLAKEVKQMNMLGNLLGIFDIDTLTDRNMKSPDSDFLSIYETDAFRLCSKNRVLTEHSQKTITQMSDPFNLYFVFKNRNKGKLHGHHIFFNQFWEKLDPKYIILLDCATEPKKDAFHHIISEYNKVGNEDVSGVCGEIRIKGPDEGFNKRVWLQIAQDVEYRTSHYMDKPIESAVGYIQVLPGAFSSYKWKKLDNVVQNAYFKCILPQHEVLTCSKANMHLAEDRVLTYALFTRIGRKNTLRYASDAIAYVDCPVRFVDIIAQRRRWINGTWFTMRYAFDNMLGDIRQSDHGCWITFWILFYIYIFKGISTLFVYLSPGIYYVFIHTTMRLLAVEFECITDDESVFNHDVWGPINLFRFFTAGIYAIVVILNIIISLGNRPQHNRNHYIVFSALIGFVTVAAILSSCLVLISKSTDEDKGYGVLLFLMLFLGTFASFMLVALFHKQFIATLRGITFYLMLLPSYTNIFLIYAFCNMHEITWGNRNDVDNHVNIAKDDTVKFTKYRTRFIMTWIIANLVFIFLLVAFSHASDIYYLIVSSCIMLFVISIKVLASLYYAIKRLVEKYKNRMMKREKKSSAAICCLPCLKEKD